MKPRGMAIATDAPALLLGLLRVGDLVLVVAGAIASFWLRHDTLDIPGIYLVGIVVGALLTANVLHLSGAYTLHNLQQLGTEIGQLLASWSSLVLSLIVLAYFTKTSDEVSRLWLTLWVTLSFTAMVLLRFAAYWQLQRWLSRGLLKVKIAIIGATDIAEALIQHLRGRMDGQFEIVGIYDARKTRVPEKIAGIRVSGTLADLVQRIRQNPIDEVVITMPWHARARVAAIVKDLKTLPVNVRLCPEGIGLELPTRGFITLGGVPMLGVFERPLAGWSLVLKALEDRMIAGLVLVLVLPLMAIIAIAIKLDSAGPVLFRQKRYGFNNNEITVFKFRTMVAEAGPANDVRQATRNDPRVTRVGVLLRRTSLDELPQLFNVIKGDMSLVGPRPHAVAHNEQFAKVIDDYLSRHRMKPGITGWAQVNGFRGEVDTPRKMQQRVQHDLYYIDNWSLLFDLKILFLTLFVGFAHQNAY